MDETTAAWRTTQLGPDDDPAVDRKHGAVNERGLVRREEEIGVGDVLWLAEATDRCALDHRREDLLGHLTDHLGPDESGRDRVHGDSLRPELASPDLRHSDDRGLGRDVVGLP